MPDLPPAPIKIGLLCVPAPDDDACAALRRALAAVPGALITLESSAGFARNWLEQTIADACDVHELDLLLTVGGTLPAPGPAPLETVPAATLAVADRLLPGLAEAIRQHMAQETRLAWLHCGVAAVRSRTLLLNLPAGAAPAVLALEAVADLIPAVAAHLRGDPAAPRLADDLEFTDGAPAGSSSPEESAGSAPGGLDPAEFAAFLRRKPKT
jgi:hypothetical protein